MPKVISLESDRRELFYDGNSQDGINGGAVMALSPDIKAGVLGIPGKACVTRGFKP